MNHPSTTPSLSKQPNLLDQARAMIRMLHYSRRTEEAYVDWIKRFIFIHNKRHPMEMGEKKISEFLSHLAVSGNVAASTQNQVMCAIVFLYKHILKKDMGGFKNIKGVPESPPFSGPLAAWLAAADAKVSVPQVNPWFLKRSKDAGGLIAISTMSLRRQ